MRTRIDKVLIFVLSMFLLETSGWAQGCAMCRTALENSPEGRALAGTFNYAILFLMAMPYVLFAAVGFGIYRAYRQRKQKNIDSPAA
jgi:hypothetical protein